MLNTLAFCIFSILLAASTMAQPANPQFFDTPQGVVDSGYFQLQWRLASSGEGQLFELQKADRADFSDAETIYKGPDQASFQSGLGDGQYFYRVRALSTAAASPWSESTTITVQHVGFELAIPLFAVGLIVFAAIAFVIWRGESSPKPLA